MYNKKIQNVKEEGEEEKVKEKEEEDDDADEKVMNFNFTKNIFSLRGNKLK